MQISREIRQYILENDPVKKATTFRGLPIDLEWLDGEVRTYPGSPYKNPLDGFHYGYIHGTHSRDGEEIDVYLKNPPDENAPTFILEQLKKGSGKLDEYKFFLGFDSKEEVRETYSNFMEPDMCGKVEEFDFEDLVLISLDPDRSNLV